MAGQVHMFAAASRLVLMALFSPAVDLFPREGSTRPPGGGAASVGASGKEYETASEVIVGEGMPLRDDFFKEEARRGEAAFSLPSRRPGEQDVCLSDHLSLLVRIGLRGGHLVRTAGPQVMICW